MFDMVCLTQDTTPLGRVLNRFSQDIALMDLQMPRIFEFTMQHGSVVAVGIFGASVLAWPVIVLLVLVAFPLYKLQSRYNAATWWKLMFSLTGGTWKKYCLSKQKGNI